MSQETRKPYAAPTLVQHGAFAAQTLTFVAVTSVPEIQDPDLAEYPANI